VGSSANKPLITGSNGVIQAGSFGNAANTFCEGNDPRLSDSRTPTSHNQDASTITISDTFSMFGTCSSQRVLNGVINEAFEALQILLGNVGSSDNVPFTSAILQNESVLVFTAIGNIVFVEYSLKGSSNSATDELLVTNYLPAIYRPENCTKYFDLAPHRNDATGVRLNITPQGHVGVTPLTANPIASYGSFFYLRQTTTYNGGV